MPFPEPAKVNSSLSTTCRHTGGVEADHSFLTSAPDGGEWLTASAGWPYPQDRIGGWVGLRAVWTFWRS